MSDGPMYITVDLPTSVDELSFVDEDVAVRFRGYNMQWVPGTPTNMQLVKELRLLRQAIESMTKEMRTRSNE